MSDEIVLNSIYKVAYDMAERVVYSERDVVDQSGTEFRRYYLDLYAECLKACQGKRSVTPIKP